MANSRGPIISQSINNLQIIPSKKQLEERSRALQHHLRFAKGRKRSTGGSNQIISFKNEDIRNACQIDTTMNEAPYLNTEQSSPSKSTRKLEKILDTQMIIPGKIQITHNNKY